MDDAEKLVEGIISGEINKSEVIEMYHTIADKANAILNESRSAKPRRKTVAIFKQLKEIFVRSGTNYRTDDRTDNRTDNETNDNEQPDTTDIPHLESEKSA